MLDLDMLVPGVEETEVGPAEAVGAARLAIPAGRFNFIGSADLPGPDKAPEEGIPPAPIERFRPADPAAIFPSLSISSSTLDPTLVL